jgi:tetratricopeptide (TPR) repeat protein
MNQGFANFVFSRGLHKRALQYFDKSIALDPLEPRFYLSRGINSQWLGHFEKAETDFLKALQLEPHYQLAIENYAHLLIESNRIEEANTMIKQLDKDTRNLNFLNAKLAAAKGEWENALQLMGTNQNLQIIGLLGDKEKGVSFYNSALDEERKTATSYYWLYKTNPCYDKLRDDPRFQEYLLQHKILYDENLLKYGNI